MMFIIAARLRRARINQISKRDGAGFTIMMQPNYHAISLPRGADFVQSTMHFYDI